MTTYTSLLKKTGQTTSYNAGDDGALELGAANSYTLLDTGQYSGTTDIVMDGRTDTHSNNCVLDNTTGLMWSSTAGATTIGPDSGKGPYGIMPWTTDENGNGIFAYCTLANTAELSGYDDWRIPNLLELLSIHICETGLAPSPFPNTELLRAVWTSTTDFSNTGYALQVYFSGSYVPVIVADKVNSYWTFGYVWLVRGSPSAPSAGGGSLISGMVD